MFSEALWSDAEKQSYIDMYIKKLDIRFEKKIEHSKYYLSYSGGKDSHLLYWYIKELRHFDDIEIVGVNTSFEIPEIRERIMKYSDVVLHPELNRWQIKEQYGIPCFSKVQDEFIHRYQKGNRSENTMGRITGSGTCKFALNTTARELTLSGKMHKCSRQCCVYNKERPMQHYGAKNGKNPIMGVRTAEGANRKNAYRTCMTKKGAFTPIYDFPDFIVDWIYQKYEIEVPRCYQYLERTGCAGCPYGKHIETELALLPELQRQQVIKYFKESYDVLGVDYENLQMVIY